MSASMHVPKAVRFKNAEDISKTMLQVQSKESGRVKIISINYDQESNEWVVFYYPIRSIDGGTLG